MVRNTSSGRYVKSDAQPAREARIMTSESERLAIKGDYTRSTYESLKESGVLNSKSGVKRKRIQRPAKIA